MKLFLKIAGSASGWLRDRGAVAAAEFALVFPLMLTMLLGIYEVGSAISMNLKTISASQMIVDLITRNDEVTDDQISDAIRAGELAMGGSANLDDMGVDVISVRYDDNDDPQEEWRVTRRIQDPEEHLVDRAAGLGRYGDGVVMVLVNYTYRPLLTNTIIGNIHMQEVSFARGRNTAVVTKAED
jgi:hypothetical protein